MNRRSNLDFFAAYAAGGGLLAFVGPDLWKVDPVVAWIAAGLTSACFAAAHLLMDAHARADRAVAIARQSRQEVARLRSALAEAGAPASAVAEPAETAPTPQAEAELMDFAARVNERCAAGTRPAANEDTVAPPPSATNEDTAMQLSVADAIADARVDIHLQPIVRLPGRQPLHYEALSRVRDATGEVVMPAEFLPAAAAAGIAAALENLQLARIVELCDRIGGRRPQTRLFCNLSATALQNKTFRTELIAFMRGRSELARRIVFETSARAALALNAGAIADLGKLKALGFSFSIDSAELAQIPRLRRTVPALAFVKVDAAKLLEADRVTVAALPAKGITLVAARVETDRVAAKMADLGISCGQGYVFGHPKPARMDAPRLAA